MLTLCGKRFGYLPVGECPEISRVYDDLLNADAGAIVTTTVKFQDLTHLEEECFNSLFFRCALNGAPDKDHFVAVCDMQCDKHVSYKTVQEMGGKEVEEWGKGKPGDGRRELGEA